MNKQKSLIFELFKIVIPIAIQNLLVTIVSASDALMLGIVNEASLSTANLAGQILQIHNAFLMSLCLGTTVLAAQYWGNKDEKSVAKVLNITLQISIIGSILFFLACLLAPRTLMLMFTNDAQLLELGAIYLRYVSGSFLFMSFSQVYMIIMKNTGRVTLSAVYGGVAVVLNILLDALLIFGLFGMPKMGVAGAALATTISRGIEFILTVISSRGKNGIKFEFKGLFQAYKALRRKYWRYTSPSMLQMMLWRVATTITIAILSHMGNEVVAANAVALIVINIVFSVANALASGAGIMIGHSLGEGELEKAKKDGDSILKIALVTGVILAVIMISTRTFVADAATSLSDASRAYLKSMIVVLAFKLIGVMFNCTTSNGIFVAGGDVKYIMKADIINMWFVIVPIGLLAAFVFKLPVMVVYAIVNMDEYTKIYFQIRHYRKYVWVKNLTKKEWAEPGRYEQLLRERIIRDMPMGVMVISSHGKISMTNNKVEELLGYTKDELEGERFAQLFVEDERNNDFVQAIVDAVVNKGIIEDELVEYYNEDSRRKLQVRSEFVEEEDLNIGVLVMLNDISKYA